MKKYIYLFSIFFLLNCKERNMNSVKFEQYRTKNIETCVSTLITMGIDSITAKERCTCMIDVAYSIDSSFVNKNEEERNKG